MVMARKGGLTVKAVENLQARAERYEVPDPGCAGLYLQIHPSGLKSWAYRFRFAGKSRKLTIGTAYTEAGVEVLKIGDARNVADEARVFVARRIDPIQIKKEQQKKAAEADAAAENTLQAIAEIYLEQPENKRLRTIAHRRKVFERLIFPALGTRPFASIKRSEIVKALDEIAKSRGPVMADYALAALRRLMTWHAARSDDYASPVIRGMVRTSAQERARSRTLSEIEIRALWGAAGEAGLFGGYLKLLLLTATRRNECAHLRRSEIDGDDWTIPAARYKTKLDHVIPLSPAAVAIIADIRKIGRSDLVFTNDGISPMANWGARKDAFDVLMVAQLRRMAEEAGGDPASIKLERWTLHDLRRTARTLMSKSGVPGDHAEQCLGHVIRGVEGTYNRHQYYAEKKAAFAKLAELVDRIVNLSGTGVKLRLPNAA
jgi:integrase